jgi:hypothetical protein
MTFAALVLCLPSLVATAAAGQDPAATDLLVERVVGRFRSLSAEEQERIAERAYRAALASDHALARVAAALEAGAAGLPVIAADPRRQFDARRYAPALKLDTTFLERGEEPWEEAHEIFFPRFPLPVRDAVWEWDAGRNALVRPLVPLSPEKRLEALLRGSWPHPGRLEALAEARFDDRGELDPLAEYFRHHYRDRAGRVFVGMRLEDVWGSGREIEVSDVEAVAWLRRIAGETKPVSPIPGKLHDPIYRRIAADFERWRDYRQLRQALAASLVASPPELPLAYRGLAERLEQTWQDLGHDPGRALALLRATEDRPGFFAAAGAVPPEERAAPVERAGLPAWLRQAAETVCREEGLLGLGRR